MKIKQHSRKFHTKKYKEKNPHLRFQFNNSWVTQRLCSKCVNIKKQSQKIHTRNKHIKEMKRWKWVKQEPCKSWTQIRWLLHFKNSRLTRFVGNRMIPFSWCHRNMGWFNLRLLVERRSCRGEVRALRSGSGRQWRRRRGKGRQGWQAGDDLLKPTTQYRNLHCSVFCGMQSEEKRFVLLIERGMGMIFFLFLHFFKSNLLPIILSSK